jgi:uncharacterized protein
MKVLLDTNIVVSAIAWGGKPGQLISAAVQELITLYTSPRLIAELSEVLHRPHIATALAKKDHSPNSALNYYQTLTIVVTPSVVPRIVPNDPDDDHVIAAALTANANLIVSGDQHLLDLPPSERFNILNPAKACVMVFNL